MVAVSFKKKINIYSGPPKHVEFVRSIGDQTAFPRKERELVNCWQAMLGGNPDGCSAMDHVFFFQAEDGIRDADVTGVQTCALPIFAACTESPDSGWVTQQAR